MSRYLHGTAPVEQRRLTALNEILNTASLLALAPRRGETLLDFGAGLAQLTRDIARVTGARAVGIELSAEQIAEARQQAAQAGEPDLVELRQGDAVQPPLRADEWGSFDLAHGR